ncbi:hypothetical protein [Wolbachia endosymbiont of Chironomus riparius]|uniref:hypothetical protein n=1 Tax=Wolbachia endosymbiont of Chironomus riparius TaxID=2883238 RepID=UPI0020A1B0BA|nr:hypothetical protein [Wolbachia endosymbiont of Chironomus riparius]
MFNIIKHIHLILNEAEYSDNKNEFVVENDCIMNQFDEVLHSTINFDILIKETDNE